MTDLPETIDDLPNFCGGEAAVERALAEHRDAPVFLPDSRIDFERIASASAIALHMHQPLIPAGGDDLRHAAIISNLQYMMEHPGIGDNHNAPVFRACYRRMGEFIPQLLAEGLEPRVMLDYSGTLLHGLRRMGLDDVIDALKAITCHPEHRRAVEWLGAPWGHAVAPSTPVQDYRLHVRAWQHHFAAIFGFAALARVRGFSPAEMALPNHPDVAHAFVATLLACGYRWVLVQEHTVEQPGSGAAPQLKHLPHRLVCTSSRGETAEIVAIIKTQGSDSKLVGQMQPWYEARGLAREPVVGRSVPPLVTQIADGENGGVMMNEFPSKYFQVVREASASATPLMNVTEYLEHLFACGVREADLPPLQPRFQARIWERVRPGDGPDKLARAIAGLKAEDARFDVEGGSWTNDLSWVRGYENVIGPMERASALFHRIAVGSGVPTHDPRYRNALFHLLTSQTSCYRYWGQGAWTDYGRELCRRVQDILCCDFPQVGDGCGERSPD
jgi:hypothetical protein